MPQQPDGIFEEIYEPQGPMANLPRCENAPVGQGGVCTRSRFIETLPNGRSHSVLNIDSNGYGDNTDVFTVPPGQYFFMGDNRDNSLDSRVPAQENGVGFVPAENLVGKAQIILLSWNPGASLFKPWTWVTDARPSRFFNVLK